MAESSENPSKPSGAMKHHRLHRNDQAGHHPKPISASALCLMTILAFGLAQRVPSAQADELPRCAPNWRVQVVAAAPRVVHPTAVADAPDGRIFVCEDFMDMAGPVDRPVNRILCIHPDGHITTFAEQIYACFGMEYIDGRLYVHHSPRFSIFDDGGAAGKNRVELIATTNPAPWGSAVRGKNQINDHVPAGFLLAMDGYLYIAVGDKGLHGFVSRDGRPLELPIGGVVRMRPDGADAEVYATGFRTILNPAINDEGDLFVFDNNDHLNIHKTAVGHVVDGGYYGYPWDDRPPRPGFVLPMDVRVYEGGAPTGILAYNADGLPPAYRGNLLLCDWGAGCVVRLGLGRRGAGYAVITEEKLLAGNIRPTGIALANDGVSFYIGDWQFAGWRENVKVGRLLKLTYQGKSAAVSRPAWYLPAAMGLPFETTADALLQGLSHPSRDVRMVAQRRLAQRGRDVVAKLTSLLADKAVPSHARWHAVWTLDAIDSGVASRAAILDAVRDQDASVALQAIRQLGTRRVIAAQDRIAERVDDRDAAVRFQAVTALGRIGAERSVSLLRGRLADDDRLIRHAAFVALNRVGRAHPAAWEPIIAGLSSDRPRVRDGTAFALRETYDIALVRALMQFVGRTNMPGSVRSAAYRCLFPLHRQPPEWDGLWWRLGPLGYMEDARDAKPRQPKTREWPGTPLVIDALHAALEDPDPLVRTVAIENASDALDRGTVARLVRLFEDPASVEVRPAILKALASARQAEAAAPVLSVLRDPLASLELLGPAIAVAQQQGGARVQDALIGLAETEIPPAALAAGVLALGELKVAAAFPVLRARLEHADPGVRAAAVKAMARIGGDRAVQPLIEALDDPILAVRNEAVKALGELRANEALPELLRAYHSAATRPAAIIALARMPDRRALGAYLDGLADKDPGLRAECRKALTAIRDQARTEVREKLSAGAVPAAAVEEIARIYEGDRALASLIATQRGKPQPSEYAAFALAHRGDAERGRIVFHDPRGVGCNKCHRVRGEGGEGGPDLTHIATNYGRAELAEAVLFPSKRVADGFRLTTIALANGQILSGVVVEESGERVALIDSRGIKHVVRRPEIEERAQSDRSPMPDGLELGLTRQEFADLVTYLESLK